MSPDYWIERWQQQNIGFHLDEINPALMKQLPLLGINKQHSCLIPLCGKSLDLGYLETRFQNVIGVELSQLAVKTFFDEQKCEPLIENQPDFVVYKKAGLRLVCGDFFKFTPGHCPPVDFIYDRAALVALPSALRKSYINHLKRFFSSHTVMFLVTLSYDQKEMQGPPFSVEFDEIHTEFGQDYDIELLTTEDLASVSSKPNIKALSRLHECCYKIRKKTSPEPQTGDSNQSA